MPVMFARFRVLDFEHWKRAFHENEGNRQDYGLTVRAVYQDATYANGVVIVYDAKNLELAQDFFQSDAQRERMSFLGLAQAAELWMTTEFAPTDNPLSQPAEQPL